MTGLLPPARLVRIRALAFVVVLGGAAMDCRCDDTPPAAVSAGAPEVGTGADAAGAKAVEPAPVDEGKAARLIRAVREGSARLVMLPPGKPDQLRNLEKGKAMLLAGDKETALAHFQAASQGPLTGARVSAMLALGDVHRDMGRPAESLALHEEAARVAPGVPEVQLQLSRAYSAVGRAADAERVVRQAVKLEPRLLAGWVDLGGLLVRAGRPQEAAEAYLSYEKYLFTLVRSLRDGEESDRLIAVDALSLARDDKAIQALLGRLDDPSAAVRAATAQALGDSASAVAADAIAAHLVSERSEEVRTALTQAAQRLRADLKPHPQDTP